MQNTFKVRVVKSPVTSVIGKEFVVLEDSEDYFEFMDGAYEGFLIPKSDCEIIEYPKPFCEDTFNEFVATLKHPETAQEVLKQYKESLTTKKPSKVEEDAVELLKSLGYEVKKPSVAKPDVDGWIPWSGGKVPVDGDIIVEIKVREGYINEGSASEFHWHHSKSDDAFCGYDIIAYRIINND